MKARELIEKLSALDPDTEVMALSSGCGCCGGGEGQSGILVRYNDAIAYVHPEEPEKFNPRPGSKKVRLR